MPTSNADSPFIVSLTPRPADIDGLNHTNNAVYVQWCEQAAWAHSHALGLSIDDYRRLDRAMAIRSASYDYLLPTVEGEQLALGTWLTPGDSKLSMRRHFQLRREADGAIVMLAVWELICIELLNGKPKRMPVEFVEAYLPR